MNSGLTPPAIVLCTLNARYIHASLGLRYLFANMQELKSRTILKEYTTAKAIQDIAQDLLETLSETSTEGVQIIGFGVYIWNVEITTALVSLLKKLNPLLKIVLGGPEVSFETEDQEIAKMADHVITGWGDISFPTLCRALLYGPRPLMKVIPGEQVPLKHLLLPYEYFTDEDIAHRILYVESSRGCPFKCEFCLSSLDKTAQPFDLEAFLFEMQKLYERGARHFKFVDRTFNLKIDVSIQILEFFLDKLTMDASNQPANLFVHFEVIPDHLPDRLKETIAKFPKGILQFEIGIQSFNEEVQKRISRKQDNVKTVNNLNWLINQTKAHLHTDLIFGLPGESWDSFALGFDKLYALDPDEIQLGLLKRLRGTPISRHTISLEMVYDKRPPYAVQSTSEVSAQEVIFFVRFSRYWDLISNSGRFRSTLKTLLMMPLPKSSSSNFSPFESFGHLSGWLWIRTEKTSGLSPEELVDALFFYLTQERSFTPEEVRKALLMDYVASGARSMPEVLKGLLPKLRKRDAVKELPNTQRQDRHQRNHGISLDLNTIKKVPKQDWP